MQGIKLDRERFYKKIFKNGVCEMNHKFASFSVMAYHEMCFNPHRPQPFTKANHDLFVKGGHMLFNLTIVTYNFYGTLF